MCHGNCTSLSNMYSSLNEPPPPAPSQETLMNQEGQGSKTQEEKLTALKSSTSAGPIGLNFIVLYFISPVHVFTIYHLFLLHSMLQPTICHGIQKMASILTSITHYHLGHSTLSYTIFNLIRCKPNYLPYTYLCHMQLSVLMQPK